MKLRKRQVFLWALYDFANSFPAIVFYLYFSQWLVLEKGVSDIWYNMTFVVSSVILILTAPVLGAVADRSRRELPFLRITSVLQLIFLLLTSIIVSNFSQNWLGIILAMVSFVFANYFYLLTFTFYTPLLSQISNVKNRGFIWGGYVC